MFFFSLSKGGQRDARALQQAGGRVQGGGVCHHSGSAQHGIHVHPGGIFVYIYFFKVKFFFMKVYKYIFTL